MDHHVEKPSFFTIIREGHNTNQVKIPPNFLKYLKGNFPSDANLVGPSGEKWKVAILREGNDMYMKNGWSKFLKEHSVMHCEFLLFTYDDGEFRVQIFSKSGCERLYLNKMRHEEAATPSLKRKKKGTTQKISTKCRQQDLPKVFSPKPLRQVPIKTEEAEACKLAETFTSTNPYVKRILKKSNVENQCLLQIASEFARKYIPEAVKEMILHNSKGKKWKVKVTRFQSNNEKRYTRFSKGWGKFVEDNKLKIGDTCIFELEGKNQMKVHTFKC